MAMITYDVSPLLDILNTEFAKQYQPGAYWAQYGDEQDCGPQLDRYLLVNATWHIEKGRWINPEDPWLPHFGFYLGMIRGGVLSPEMKAVWSAMTTLVTLCDPHFTRGYHAGRVWFFYEADQEERRLTDVSSMQRLHELAIERHQYRNETSTINFALGCMIGELSGQLFPLMQEERERIQEEDRQFMIAYEAQRTNTAVCQKA